MSEYSVELKGLNKVYSNLLKEDTVALKDINLQIRPVSLSRSSVRPDAENQHFYGSSETSTNRHPARSSTVTAQTSRWALFSRILSCFRGRM